MSNSSLFTPALLRTHSFVFFAVHETSKSFSTLSSQRCQGVFFHSFWVSSFHNTWGTGTYPLAPVVYSRWVCGTLCRRSLLPWSCRRWWVGYIYSWVGLCDPPVPVVLPPKWTTRWCHQRSEGSWLFALQFVVQVENPRWRTAAIFKNRKNCYFFVTAWPMDMIFEKVAYADPPNCITS